MSAAENSPTPLPGSTYRFVVNSAEEAVRMIHEKLGAAARVISVKQLGGRGFVNMLRSPQLEVIAEVAAPEETAPPIPAEPVEASLPAETETETAWQNEGADPVDSSMIFGSTLERVLFRAGISRQTLAFWRISPGWERWSSRPLGESLKEVVEMLRAQWNSRTKKPMGRRVVFFGPPGCGSTTALCKALTTGVFFRKEMAMVIKLEGDQPNPAEGLAMFCEALDVPLLRSADELEFAPPLTRIYFDAAGPSLHEAAAWRNLGALLGEFFVETRVLVLNAAYDLELLKRGYTLGREAGATHIVFTHLDELRHWGKLWDLLSGGGLQPLFFGCGQNISGDLHEDTFEQIIQRMFGGLK